MKKEWPWIAGFLVISIYLVGLLTEFTYSDVELSQFGSYGAISVSTAVLCLTVLLYTIRNLYLLVRIIMDRNKIAALLVSILNPILGLAVLFALYNKLQTLDFQASMVDSSAKLILIFILSGIATLQVLTEVSALKHAAMLFNKRH